MSYEAKGPFPEKWIINNSRTGRLHLIYDTEAEADLAMDGLKNDAECYESWKNNE
jgi:hypothetical protein